MIVPLALRRWGARHLDEFLGLVVLVWGTIDTLVRHVHTGPLALNLAVVVVAAAVALVRRRLPLVFVVVTLGAALASALWLDNVVRFSWSIYMVLSPAYTAAAWCERPRAVAGLVLAVVGAGAVDAVQPHVVTDMLYTTICAVASWTVGRAIRHRRVLARALRHRAQWLEDEREDRARLAVADERSRIARELHALVANSVSAMVVQAEAAQRLLDDDPDRADESMAQIEATGREALAEMRRILGVLRRGGAGPELAPQPGVGQLHTLVEEARSAGRRVGLHVEGDPAPLPVSVDLAVYRIVEEALLASTGDTEVDLRFVADEVELEIACASSGEEQWPTVAMSERVALCEGTIDADTATAAGTRLSVRLPQSFAEAFA